MSGLPGIGGGIGRLLQEADDLIGVIHMHDAEAGGFHPRHLDAGDGHVGAALDVPRQHGGVIHLVDVVAGQDQHMLGAVAHQDVEVLVHRVGGALVPDVSSMPLLGGQEVDELVDLAAQEAPAALKMGQQAVGLVLGDDADPAEA